tara:strand:+ start:772 stop:2037 length:1266 start_codon:yes stop_codon:yes gene_type:complete
MIKKNFLLLSITAFVYLSFFLGYFLQENSAGGGAIDFDHISNNILLFNQNNFLEIDWSKYESTSLPIYYLIIKSLNISNFFTIGLFNMFISLSSVLIFFKILSNISRKYSLKTDSVVLFSISSLPLLSPYFRTSTFWMLEENIGYLFMLLSIFFLTRQKTYLNIFCCIIFSSLAFYSRQSYAFLPLIIFFNFINFKKLLTYKNIFIINSFLIFLLPSLYFFKEWGGLVPPAAIIDRPIEFNFINLPIIFSICFFYLIPFLIIENKKNLWNFISDNKYIIFLSLIFFYLIFFDKINTEQVYYKFKLGGGLIYKINFHLNLLIKNFFIQKIFFIFISWIGLLSIAFYFLRSLNLKIFFLVFIIIFSNANIVFQEYFDPMITILMILFYKAIDPKCNFKKLYFILFGYKSILLLSCLTYYYRFV